MNGSSILVYNVAFVIMLFVSFMLFGIVDTPFLNNWLAIVSSIFTVFILIKCIRSIAIYYRLIRLKKEF